MKLTIDFETRSQCDLKKHGAWVYSLHPSTEYICLAVKVDGKPAELHYNPRFNMPGLSQERVFELVSMADTIEAHNAPFELAMWTNVCHARMGWPELPLAKLRDSAAKCRMCGLPASLEMACRALGIDKQKDMVGHRLMLKMCKPVPEKSIPAHILAYGPLKPGIVWHEQRADLRRLGEYCIADTEAEHQLSNALPDLPPYEQKVWLWDLTVNLRGLPVDTHFAARAIEMLDSRNAVLMDEFKTLTGSTLKPSQVQKLLKELEQYELELPELGKKTVTKTLLKGDLHPTARRLLEIRAATSRSSTAKFQTLLDLVDGTGCIRFAFVYHGAGTGRWTAKGFQPHNLPRGDFTDTEPCINMIADRDWDGVEAWYGPVQMAASTCIRGAIQAEPGHEFVAADLNAIEPRVTAWIADENHVLDVYREGKDNYKATYGRMFGVRYEDVSKEQRNKVGKPCVLLLGFGGGKNALHRGTDNAFTDEEAQALVDKWRLAHPKIVACWKDLERCAKMAVKNPGQAFALTNRKIAFCKVGRFLVMKLPSGRKLYYCDPVLKDRGKGWPELVFWGVHPKTKQWCECGLYGGLLMENAVQAASRDILVYNMIERCETAGYPIRLHVHDEAVGCVTEGFGSVDEFEKLLATPPPWAPDLPLKAEGWRGRRYRK